MKKSNFSIYLLSGSLFFITACSSDTSTTESEEKEPSVCSYEYDESTTTLEWTAYKFEDKSGAVPGGFNEIEVTSDENEDPKKVIESIKFKINTASVETQNEDRNKKISELFFGSINTKTIEGRISKLNDDGKAYLVITMNGLDVDIEGTYTLKDGLFTFESIIDVVDWNGMKGIEKLNKACDDLHRKAPGEESKLWSEISLKLSTKLKSDC